jgi:hypothetical protein
VILGASTAYTLTECYHQLCVNGFTPSTLSIQYTLTHSLALVTFVFSFPFPFPLSPFSFVKYFLSLSLLFCVALFHTQSVPFIHRFVLLLLFAIFDAANKLPCLARLCLNE